jgi:hypothetical protein
MGKLCAAGLPIVALSTFDEAAHAATAYWDTNGSAAGAGSGPGTWYAYPTGPATWTASSIGDPSVASHHWVSGDIAVFSAGGDATGAFTVTVFATPIVGGIVF